MSSFFEKIQEDFTALVVGTILGIPAIGILLPQIFTLLGNSEIFQLSSLFRIFCLLYFTLPFLMLILLFVFQLNDILVKELRARLFRFLLFIICIYILILFFSRNGTYSLFGKVIILLSLFSALAFYIFSLWKSIIKIDLPEWHQENADNIEIIKNQETIPNLIKFSIFILYIPIQLLISILFISFYRSYDNWWFVLVSGSLYMIPPYIYWNHPRIIELKKIDKKTGKRKISGNFIPKTLMFLSCLLILIQILSNITNRHWSLLNDDVENYSDKFIMTNDLKNINDDLDYISYVQQGYSIKNDSIKFSDDLNLLNYLRQDDKDSFLSITQAQTKDENLLVYSEKKRFDTSIVSKYSRLIQFIESTRQTPEKKYQLLNSYAQLLNKNREIKVSLAQKNLLEITTYAQKTGVTVFINLIIIFLTFLFILFFKDEKYNFSNSTEAGLIRKLIQTVCVITLILAIPLVKTVSIENINPEKPWKLFQISNWNLAPGLGLEENNEDENNNNIRCCKCMVDSLFYKWGVGAKYPKDTPFLKVATEYNPDSLKLYLSELNAFKTLLDSIKQNKITINLKLLQLPKIYISDTATALAIKTLGSGMNNNTMQLKESITGISIVLKKINNDIDSVNNVLNSTIKNINKKQ